VSLRMALRAAGSSGEEAGYHLTERAGLVAIILLAAET